MSNPPPLRPKLFAPNPLFRREYSWYPYKAPTQTPTNRKSLMMKPNQEPDDTPDEDPFSLSRGLFGSARMAEEVVTEIILGEARKLRDQQD